MATPKIYRYSVTRGVHRAVDMLQTELEKLNYIDETDIANPIEVNWFDVLFGLSEEGENNMPYGWSEAKDEHISTISDDKNKCQAFFVWENEEEGIGYTEYSIAIYIFMNEARISNAPRGIAMKALCEQIKGEVFLNNGAVQNKELLSIQDSQMLNNNILQSAPLVDSNFNPFKDKTIYGKVTCKIRVFAPCDEPFKVGQIYKCG